MSQDPTASDDEEFWTRQPLVMTPSDVAKIFRVNPKTVSRWGSSLHIPCFRTAGGHRRYRREEIRKFFDGQRDR